jgi:hypothetical protein
VKVNLKVWFFVTLVVEPKTPAVSLVTVWGASEVLSHTTCVPTLIVSVAGWKEYFSFASTIFTVTTVGVGVGVGLGGDVGVAVGVGGIVAVGVEVVAAPPPPHAATRSAAMIASEKNTQDNRTRPANDDGFLFIFMTITSSGFNGAFMTKNNVCDGHSLERYAKRLQATYNSERAMHMVNQCQTFSPGFEIFHGNGLVSCLFLCIVWLRDLAHDCAVSSLEPCSRYGKETIPSRVRRRNDWKRNLLRTASLLAWLVQKE